MSIAANHFKELLPEIMHAAFPVHGSEPAHSWPSFCGLHLHSTGCKGQSASGYAGLYQTSLGTLGPS